MNDKILHFIVGFLLSLLGIFFLPLILLGFIFGVCKEIYDIKYGAVETKDVLATFFGAILAVIVVVILWMNISLNLMVTLLSVKVGYWVMAVRIKTHDEIFLLYLKSVKNLTEAIVIKNKQLKEADDYDEETQLHNTKSLIKRWFFNNGLLPI